jgi:hypothetical protein
MVDGSRCTVRAGSGIRTFDECLSEVRDPPPGVSHVRAKRLPGAHGEQRTMQTVSRVAEIVRDFCHLRQRSGRVLRSCERGCVHMTGPCQTGVERSGARARVQKI